MMRRPSPLAFSVTFCIAYAASLQGNLPMFIYYPLHGDFSWGPAIRKGLGPGMAWYGLMATAGAAAILAATIVPNRLVANRLRSLLWIFPCGAMLVCVAILRVWFG